MDENMGKRRDYSGWILKKEIKSERKPFIFSSLTEGEIYRGIRKRGNLGDCVHIVTNDGEEIASVKRKYWAIKLNYSVYVDGRKVARVKRTFDLKRISYTVDELDFMIIGEVDEKQTAKAGYGRKRSTILEKRYLEYKFRMIDRQDNVIMEFYPDVETSENFFHIQIYDKQYELYCLCIALAVYLAIDEMNRPD